MTFHFYTASLISTEKPVRTFMVYGFDAESEKEALEIALKEFKGSYNSCEIEYLADYGKNTQLAIKIRKGKKSGYYG